MFDGAMYAVYNFDNPSRLADIANSSDSTATTFGYDNENKLTSRTFPNDLLKRLKDVSSTATLFDRQYSYNPTNQIGQIAELTQIKNFTYDIVERLTGMTNGSANESYTFNGVGNRTASHRSASYGYQPFNKIASTATATMRYDSNGNVVQKSEGSNFWRYVWDYENRLTQASTRKQTVRYLYDALGRRVRRHTPGLRESTKFIYDGLDVVMDNDVNTGITKYQNGLGIDNKLKMVTSGQAKYFLQDHLGSTVGLADATGTLTSQTAYDSFGNQTGALATRYGFTGRERDDFTGLMYYRARFYDAKLGRFISEDPIGFGGGDVNLYGYVWNNPLHFVDPMGLDGWGNDFADWADEKTAYARNYWQGDPQSWVWNGSVNTGADLAHGFSDMFRVGSGLGCAIYSEDENPYGRAAFVAMDVARAAGIFTALAGPIAKPASIGKEYSFGNNFRIAPFGNRTGHPIGEWPHYHRPIPDPARRPGHNLPGQTMKNHRPWEGGW